MQLHELLLIGQTLWLHAHVVVELEYGLVLECRAVRREVKQVVGHLGVHVGGWRLVLPLQRVAWRSVILLHHA